jgi:CDP-glycerol glycerophosphotransferase (TagB/SpsB family)
MYMVSLNSDMRTGFRNADLALQRTVVSSELEAKHFIDLADMKREDLYITGLAKFDRCWRRFDADRIVIMLTWRRWETNQARYHLENTGYFRMIRRIFASVPEKLRDKVVILPHPLMAERFAKKSGGDANGNTDKITEEMSRCILMADSYDEVLRGCDLLITDYSSIAYDAFYRGANVIFCWEEKDECMEHYGEGTYLMLNEDNVFGPVCMTGEEITSAVRERYKQLQTEEDKARYSRIVEFHDGRNAERILELMKKDGLL